MRQPTKLSIICQTLSQFGRGSIRQPRPLNVDVKKIYMQDGSSIDPWVLGAGVGFKL